MRRSPPDSCTLKNGRQTKSNAQPADDNGSGGKHAVGSAGGRSIDPLVYTQSQTTFYQDQLGVPSALLWGSELVSATGVERWRLPQQQQHKQGKGFGFQPGVKCMAHDPAQGMNSRVSLCPQPRGGFRQVVQPPAAAKPFIGRRCRCGGSCCGSCQRTRTRPRWRRSSTTRCRRRSRSGCHRSRS